MFFFGVLCGIALTVMFAACIASSEESRREEAMFATFEQVEGSEEE